MINSETSVLIERDFARRSVNIYFIRMEGNKRCILQKDGNWRVIKDGQSTEPSLSFDICYLEQGVLQQLVDKLIEIGVKPTKPTESIGEIQRLEKHLEDMRTLIFEKRIKE